MPSVPVKMKLAMWEKTMMSESVMGKDDKGKTVFTKTGNKTESTTYTFKDEYGEKLVFLSSNNNYRNLEGEEVEVQIEISHDDYNKKNKVQLKSISPLS